MTSRQFPKSDGSENLAMPIHDWSRVDAGIFHAFHHDWITELARALNHSLSSRPQSSL
jgi:hypothetical protein